MAQPSSQQPFAASALPSIGSAAITIETVATPVPNAQTIGSPLHVLNSSVYCSGTPPRPPPHISSISSSTGNLHMGSEIRAPAPHLQPFRPSTFISPTGLPSHSLGVSNQAHSNCPVASPSVPQAYSNPPVHRPWSTTCQFGRIQTETALGLVALPNSSLPSLDVLMGMNNLSGVSVYPPSNFLHGTFIHQESSMPSILSNPAQQSGAHEVICLSNDD